MFKALTFVLLFVFVFCGDTVNEKNVTIHAHEARTAIKTNVTTPSPIQPNNTNAESLTEGLKAVTNGAKQIISGIIEVGSSIISAITKWFDGSQTS